MARTNRFGLSLGPVLLAAAASVVGGCSSSDSASYSPQSDGSRNAGAAAPEQSAGAGAPNGASAERAIAEADIVQLVDGRLYAMSKSGSLSIVDVSRPGRLTMLGQAYLPGEPFEMYLRGDLLVVMTNGAYTVSGQVDEPAQQRGSSGQAAGAPAPAPSRDANAGAGVLVINVADPGLMQRVATFPVPGEIADSRVVGDILYLATYENASCWGCGPSPRTLVTTFDISVPKAMRQVDQALFESSGSTGWWAGSWRRSVVATSERFYVGGHGEVQTRQGTSVDEGVIDVLDVTDPSGKLGKGARIATTGPIVSRWQMDEKDGVLRVVSQRGAGYSTNGVGMPEVQTFHIWNTRSFQAMGKTSLQLPRQEALKSVRFDGDRAYAITFAQTDPLFVIDLSNEAAPKQRGELEMPGWVFHLEPHGNRLLGLGLDRNDPEGNLNVSLFDVADMDHPTMLERVAFGSMSYGNDQSIVSYELPEDQDRIQKAFRVFENGLIAVPFSGGYAYSNAPSSCALGGGVQLIDWNQDTLRKAATLPMAGNPRRALLNKGELLAVSDSNVTSFDLGRRDVALKTADLVIGSCDTQTARDGVPVGGVVREGGDDIASDSYGLYACASARTGSARGAGWATALLGLAAVAVTVRRRRAA